MTTELTDTLREIADEVAPTSRNLAVTALRDGRRMHARRTVLTAVAAAVAVIVLATPIVTAAVIHERSVSSLAGSSTVATLNLAPFPGARAVSAKDVADTERVLRTRFAHAGIQVIGFRPIGDSQLQVSVKGQATTARMVPLLVPNVVEIRAVLGTVADVGPEPSTVVEFAPDTPTLAQVKAKLGAAYAEAATMTSPGSGAGLAPFAQLTPAEVSVLPPSMQFNVSSISCAQLAGRPSGVTTGSATHSEIVTCGVDQSGDRSKFLLGAAAVTSADISGATTDSNPPGVEIRLHAGGQQRWTDLTRQLYDEHAADGEYRQVAILMDLTVLGTPAIEAEIPGPAVIGSRDLTAALAKSLVDQINDGALPVAVYLT